MTLKRERSNFNTMEEKYLLALDASSKEIGYSIFCKNTKTLIEINHFTQDVDHSLIEKAEAFEGLLKKLIEKYPQIDEMIIEESMMAVFGGASSAHTTTVLNQINILYRYVAYKKGLKVSTITVAESRKFMFPGVKLRTVAKLKGLKEKELCFLLLVEKIGDKLFPTKVMTRGKNKGETVFEDYAGDMADSYICGYAYLLKLNNNEL